MPEEKDEETMKQQFIESEETSCPHYEAVQAALDALDAKEREENINELYLDLGGEG